MRNKRSICARFGFRPVLNAMGTATIVGANRASPDVRAAVDEVLAMNVQIDELQAAACRLIAQATGAEAGCVTSSCSAAIAVSAAAAMTGADLSRIERLPDVRGLPNEIVLPAAHDVDFGARVSQMIELTGARLRRVGSASHCDLFHLRGAMGAETAALFYIVSGVINPAGDFPSLAECVAVAHQCDVPVVVDAAAAPDVRGFLAAGADLVLSSGHKRMGAATSGMICGKLDLVRACYLQNRGIGRAMKVGKEGIVALMAALEAWTERDPSAEEEGWRRLREILGRDLALRPGAVPYQLEVPVGEPGPRSRQIANALRESDPPLWVREADEQRGALILDLRVMSEDDAEEIGAAIARMLASPVEPREDVLYHDLYWSEERLLRWPAD